MKIKHTLFILLLLITALAGCTHKSVDINIEKLSLQLVKGVEFKDELSLIDNSVIDKIYQLPEDTAFAVYVGSGATAEEVSLFQCKDEATAKTMLEIATTHIKDQKESFADYIPEEVAKLESAIVLREGTTVIVCVTDDLANANGIIDAALHPSN